MANISTNHSSNSTLINGTTDQLPLFPPSEPLTSTALFGFSLGAAATIINIFIVIIFCSKKYLRTTSALMIGLTIAHSCNGLLHMLTFWNSQNFDFVPSLYCMKVMWPNMFITFYQMVPVFLALIGVERLLAVVTPVWYRIHCKRTRLWILTGSIFILGLLIMVANWLYVFLVPGSLIFSSCVSPMLFGVRYVIIFVHIPAIMGGLAATVCTLTGVFEGTKHIRNLPLTSDSDIERMRKQIRLTKCVLMVSCMDVLFVVIPNICLLLYNLGVITFPIEYTLYALVLFCFGSLLNIIPHLLFNKEFRMAVLGLTACTKNNVTSISIGGPQKSVL